VGWSSSYAEWGGLIRVKPQEWAHLKVGLYVATPGATATTNHGVAFAGASPASSNGLFFLGEAGVAPEIGRGKYAFGGYSWGLEATSSVGNVRDYRWGLYWQAEQMLWRERCPVTPEFSKESPPNGVANKSLSSPLSDHGLSIFTCFYFAPEAENAVPLYFHTGLTYCGLLRGRDDDVAGVVIGTGFYSCGFITYDEESGEEFVCDYQRVLGFDYRLKANKWPCAQPFTQYTFRPGGLDQVAHKEVSLGVAFDPRWFVMERIDGNQ